MKKRKAKKNGSFMSTKIFEPKKAKKKMFDGNAICRQQTLTQNRLFLKKMFHPIYTFMQWKHFCQFTLSISLRYFPRKAHSTN